MTGRDAPVVRAAAEAVRADSHAHLGRDACPDCDRAAAVAAPAVLRWAAQRVREECYMGAEGAEECECGGRAADLEKWASEVESGRVEGHTGSEQ